MCACVRVRACVCACVYACIVHKLSTPTLFSEAKLYRYHQDITVLIVYV